MDRRAFLAGGVAVAAAAAAAVPAAERSSTDLPAHPGDETGADFVVLSCDGSELTAAYVDRYHRSGVDVWCYDGPETILDFAETLGFLHRESSKIMLAKSYADIVKARSLGKVAMVMGWQNSKPLEEAAGNEWRHSRPPKTALRAYFELGLRVANLCYNLANQFGGGCLDPTVPLTRAGEFLIGQMQDMGVLVDCGGHTGEQTSLDIIKLAHRPVCCTHSNVKSNNDNPRNTSDRVIEGIARTGGVFGVTAVDAFMTWGRKDVERPARDAHTVASVSRLADDIDYLMRLTGPDHIGLGPDFYEGSEGDHFVVDPDKSFQYSPDMGYKQSPLHFVKGFEAVDQIGNVRSELQRRAYSPADIDKIMGGNWMRVYHEAWNI
jgi:membrane dipeptidase